MLARPSVSLRTLFLSWFLLPLLVLMLVVLLLF